MVNPFEETLQAGKVSDDYNIGRFGEFDRFEDERAFMPEAFERPQSTIGGYDKKFGYTLPSFENENPDNWFWGYNNPDDVVQEQQHGVWPSIKRNSPEWVKDIGKGLHDTGKLYYDHGMYSDDILDFFGWQPQDNYYSESMNERFNWDQQSKIDLDEIFRNYPDLDIWRLIQNLDARGIDYAANDRGIGSLDEYQMAELTQGQKDMMGNPLNTPDFGVSKQDLWGQVKDMEDKGVFGWGAQEPTTQEEYDDYYRQLQAGTVGNWVT